MTEQGTGLGADLERALAARLPASAERRPPVQRPYRLLHLVIGLFVNLLGLALGGFVVLWLVLNSRQPDRSATRSPRGAARVRPLRIVAAASLVLIGCTTLAS